ncbi:MAG: transcription-repair coupling factor [Proteobacteria bacterium]|nr:transcription-repair coupling factor [Pseudomonadota bacterium]MBU1716948.1 transcription-repair coupling factor [Pseudomonadota bacterium]
MKDKLKVLQQKDWKNISVTGLRGSAPALLVARAAVVQQKPVVVILPNEQQAAQLEQDLAFFSELPVLFFPGYDIPPYTPLSPDPQTVAARISTLYKLLTTDAPSLIIIPADALLRRTIPKNILADLAELVITGEDTDPNQLCLALAKAGYESMSMVQNAGEFSVRGGIVDVFPPAFDYEAIETQSTRNQKPSCCAGPVRLDFFGETIESIRQFDPISQRSVSELSEAVFLPASDILFPEEDTAEMAAIIARFTEYSRLLEWDQEEAARISEQIRNRRRFPGIEFFLPLFYDQTSTPLDFVPDDTMIILFDPIEIDRTIEITWERINANYHEGKALGFPALDQTDLFVSPAEITTILAKSQIVRLQDFPDSDAEAETGDILNISSGDHTLMKQTIELQRAKRGLLSSLADFISEWLAQKDTVIFACRSARHAANLSDLLKQYSLPTRTEQLPFGHAQKENEVILCPNPVSQGFDLPAEQLHIISESELFGEKRLSARKKVTGKTSGEPIRFEELKIDDIVVHQEHGLGVYAGLVNMKINNIINDFMQINYLINDILYVPVDRINAVSKYKGLADKTPKLDKLGSKSWASAKSKVKEAVWKVAQELLDLYGRRQLAKGNIFSTPGELFDELEESFPYDETTGQSKAIKEVIDDLTSDRVMDRLVCGDVGYGKTEVAIRAAFKVMEDGFQVAILVPTTVLAEQHLETFQERFKGFPVRVNSLNRFRSPAEQRKTVSGLADGSVDIVIGTHRLLSKDVSFKKLGLLIIDEEHRFGVSHKEKLKKLRVGVDVLTLTATPIPRTLEMSLLGVRDLSVISSPPQHRRAVKTFVARYDDLVIKEAITKELQRGGQVFLVHNRVRSIHEMARKVQNLRPEARVAVAHGQMPGKDLEEIMVRFVNREVDVLICTTIIESGLDIPNANTIIIPRADRLGLAEIYQLRGRVGRSSEQAYAYLLVPSLDGLSKDARRRLRALMDYNELGGGFKLAMSDLQIRGGGNILGESQSGNIAAVGYDLYLDLLQKTVEDLKRKGAAGEDQTIGDEVDPEINLLLSAYIPDSFITDTDQRYLAYRRITGLTTDEDLAEMRDEMRDRYGPMPEETLNLFQIIGLKKELQKLKISKLEQGADTLVFTFTDRTPVSPEKIMLLLAKPGNRWRLTPDSKLVVPSKLDSPALILAETKNVLRTLLQNATKMDCSFNP